MRDGKREKELEAYRVHGIGPFCGETSALQRALGLPRALVTPLDARSAIKGHSSMQQESMNLYAREKILLGTGMDFLCLFPGPDTECPVKHSAYEPSTKRHAGGYALLLGPACKPA